MRPTQFNNGNGVCPSPLKINKDSHFIKKSTSSPPPPSSLSSSSSTSALAANGVIVAAKPQHRHPVIIYTHSPKIIHTNPSDFKALVQKLTGLSRSDDHNRPLRPASKQEPSAGEGDVWSEEEELNKSHKVGSSNDDNDSSSVITDENCSSNSVMNSCFAAAATAPPPPPPTTTTMFDPPNPCFSSIPLFAPNMNSSDFLCPGAQSFYGNYTDSLLMMPNMMRSSISSSSSTLEGLKEFREF